MNFLHRLFTCAALCGSVACSENGTGFESAAPEQQLRTVVIGCAGIDITTRTEIDDRLGVRWVSGDSIRLWARESGAGAPFALENIPFVFDYYSPRFEQAAFTGHEVDMSRFDSGRRYDYFAVSPTPVSVAGTLATFDIPAVQSGEFNSGCDIMTAQLTDAVALEEGDTNWSIRLPFEHHVHVFKITIPSNRLESPKFPGQEEAIRSIELTFPDPVTGRLTVDATGAAEPVFTPAEGGNVLTLNFDRPKRKGDVVYAFIARQEPLSGDQQVIIKATGASGGDKPCVSVDRSFSKTREFTRGGVTTLNYNIPERYRCTKILFSLAEKAGGEAPDRAITNADGYGWGTLGEPIESFRIVDRATGEELPASAFVCNHVANRYEITCVDEGAHTAFIDRYAGKACIAKLTSQSAEVEYPFTIPALEAEVENTVPALEVPWLFEEKFNNTPESDKYHYNDDLTLSRTSGGDNKGVNLESYGFPQGWTGARCGIDRNQSVRICCRSERAAGVPGTYNGRLDSPCMTALRYDDEAHEVGLNLSFDYSMNRESSKNSKNQHYLAVGYHTTEGPINAESGVGSWWNEPLLGYKITANIQSDIYTDYFDGDWPVVNIPYKSMTEIEIKGRRSTRFVWEVYIKDKSPDGYYNNYVYLDNIRVSIAH